MVTGNRGNSKFSVLCSNRSRAVNGLWWNADTTDLRSVAGVPACGFKSRLADKITIRDGIYTCHLEEVMPERDWECESPRIDKISSGDGTGRHTRFRLS